MDIVDLVGEFFWFLGYIGVIMKSIIQLLLLPIQFIFSFLAGFFENAFASPTPPDNTFNFTNYLSFFHNLPFWTELSAVIFIGIVGLSGIFILKTLRK